MSLSFLSKLNSPLLATGAGVAVVLGSSICNGSSLSLAACKGANVFAFAINVVAVSIPGRLDGQEQQQQQSIHAKKNNGKQQDNNPYFSSRTRTLVNPAPYAFIIWLPIYLGETMFVVAQCLDSTLQSTLPLVTAPFVAANLTQALWCAAFRPSYNRGWRSFVSAALLAATAYSLDKVHVITSTTSDCLFYLPLTMHFGWITAATLVNFNGSLAMSSNVSDALVCLVGHFSIILAAVCGVTITTMRLSPTYGLTIAWACAACAKGMTNKFLQKSSLHSKNVTLTRGAKVQRVLCWIGTMVCIGASVAAVLQ